MVDQVRILWRDYSNEPGSANFNIVDITEANLVAQQALLQTMVTELAPVQLGTIQETQIQISQRGSSTPPASPLVQIENVWVVNYVDSQQYLDPPDDTVLNPGFGQPFSMEWPCADPSGTHLQTNSDYADLADDDVAEFVDAFEDVVRSRYGGTVTVVSIVYSGARV